MKKFDVIIIGGGPGGSVAASVLARSNLSVAIIERELYPRFHIGESLLPASMPIFKEIGFFDTLNSGRYLRKYGARFIDYVSDEEIYFGFADGLNPDIPMAFEVPRAQFDSDLLSHAKKSGAEVCQPENVKAIELKESHITITTENDEFRADYVIDVSGRDSVIGKHLKIRDNIKDLNNIAVFSHYQGVQRYEGKNEGDITIGLLPNRAWTWIIPFAGETTSVGVVSSSNDFDGQKDLPHYLEKKLLGSERVAQIMSGSQRTMEVTSIGNYSHACRTFFGERWILAGDAAMFLDPIFSSGVHLSISSSKLAAEAVLKIFHQKQSLKENFVGQAYEEQVRKGAKRFHGLISMFYGGNFVEQMKKTLQRENMRKGFTSAIAGDVWDETNFLFQKSVL